MDQDEMDEDGPIWSDYSFRWRWSALPLIGLHYAENVLRETADALNALKVCLSASTNHKIDREKLIEQAALEIETMTTQGVE